MSDINTSDASNMWLALKATLNVDFGYFGYFYFDNVSVGIALEIILKPHLINKEKVNKTNTL